MTLALHHVRPHFNHLKGDERFNAFLASTGNKDSITGNRMFDRRHAVLMIMEAAAPETKI